MSGHLERLLESERSNATPERDVVEAGWRGLRDTIGRGVGPSVPVDGAGLPGPASGGATAGLSVAAKASLVAIVAAAVGVGVVASRASSPAAAPVSEQTVAPLPPAEPVAGLPTDVGAVAAPKPVAVPTAPLVVPSDAKAPASSAPRPSPRRRRAATRKPDPATASRLGDEVALLQRAWTALDNGRFARAAMLLSQYERDFPEGLLTEELQAAKAAVRCHGGARGAGSAFLRQYPRSIHAGRVTTACKEKNDP